MCKCCSVFSFSSSDVEALVSKTFPILLGRLGDSAPRVVQQASETIVELLKNNSLKVSDAPVPPDLPSVRSPDGPCRIYLLLLTSSLSPWGSRWPGGPCWVDWHC